MRESGFVTRVRALAREAIRDDGRLTLAGRQRQPPRRAEPEPDDHATHVAVHLASRRGQYAALTRRR